MPIITSREQYEALLLISEKVIGFIKKVYRDNVKFIAAAYDPFYAK